MNRFYLLDLVLFAPIALFVTWPPRLNEFGSPLFILTLLLAGFMAWLPRAVKSPTGAPLLTRQLHGLLILAGIAYVISWLVPLSDYIASKNAGMSDDFHSLSRLLDGVYTGILWMVFPWLCWMTFLVLLRADPRINRN